MGMGSGSGSVGGGVLGGRRGSGLPRRGVRYWRIEVRDSGLLHGRGGGVNRGARPSTKCGKREFGRARWKNAFRRSDASFNPICPRT
jgi:hypothetical protein